MKFLSIEDGRYYSLSKITGTDFWNDQDGDLYLATEGTCERISGQKALESILRRGKPSSGYCPICDDKCLKGLPASFNRYVK